MKQRKKLKIFEEIEIQIQDSFPGIEIAKNLGIQPNHYSQDVRNKNLNTKNKELCRSLEIDYLIRKEDSILMAWNLQQAQKTSYDNDDRIDELNEDILDDELEEYFKQHPRKKKTSLELVESEPEDFYGS